MTKTMLNKRPKYSKLKKRLSKVLNAEHYLSRDRYCRYLGVVGDGFAAQQTPTLSSIRPRALHSR